MAALRVRLKRSEEDTRVFKLRVSWLEERLGRVEEKGDVTSGGGEEVPLLRIKERVPAGDAPSVLGDGWQTVGRRRRRKRKGRKKEDKRGGAGMPAATVAVAPQPKRDGGRAVVREAGGGVVKIGVPLWPIAPRTVENRMKRWPPPMNTSAVAIKLKGGLNYAEALRKARKDI